MSFEYTYTNSGNTLGKDKAIDYTETLANGNTQRTARGLSTVAWSGTTPATLLLAQKSHGDTIKSLIVSLVKYGAGDFPLTDTTLTAGITKIREQHLREVRQVIDDAANGARCNGNCLTVCGVSTCTNMCSSSSACTGVCFSCTGTCNSACTAPNGCTGSCGRGCGSGITACTHTCSSSTYSPPGASCSTNSCSIYCFTGCSGGCSNSCTATGCSALCTTSCYSTGCTNACYLNCSTSCKSNCYNTCLSSCYSGCSNSSRLGADAGSY